MTTPTTSLAGSAGTHWLTPALEIAGALAEPWLATFTPPPGARCAAAARSFTAATLAGRDTTGRVDDIVTVVSELVTNAWQHALAREDRPGIRLGLLGGRAGGPGVLCAVADPGPRPPVPREAGDLATGGRGLQVVGALSDDWGWAPSHPGGKVVWALFGTWPGYSHPPPGTGIMGAAQPQGSSHDRTCPVL